MVITVDGDNFILRERPEDDWRQWDSRFKVSDLLEDLPAERRRELEDDRNRP